MCDDVLACEVQYKLSNLEVVEDFDSMLHEAEQLMILKVKEIKKVRMLDMPLQLQRKSSHKGNPRGQTLDGPWSTRQPRSGVTAPGRRPKNSLKKPPGQRTEYFVKEQSGEGPK